MPEGSIRHELNGVKFAWTVPAAPGEWTNVAEVVMEDDDHCVRGGARIGIDAEGLRRWECWITSSRGRRRCADHTAPGREWGPFVQGAMTRIAARFQDAM